MTTLNAKIVLITGAGGGFGREMIRQFLRAGSYLILADRERAALLDAATATTVTLGRVPGKILGFVAADLSSEAGCDDLYQQVQAIAPSIDMLVNNAGIAYNGPFVAIPPEKWERLLQINLHAPLRLTAKFAPDMIRRRSGHIANVSSSAGLVGTPGLAAYSAAKWGLRGFGEALAGEVEGFGVAVTTIYPFFARTPILESEQFGLDKPQTLPDWMLYEPSFVVAALLDGIRKNKRHVYPGALPKLIDITQRLSPGLMPLLARALRPNAAR
jgi:short-subunit dehydrogenase